MIICHPHKLIFIKTKKVAGTSLEIALSAFCGPDCVITPITPEDEDTRSELGYRGPQNYQDTVWRDRNGEVVQRNRGDFFNHMRAANIRAMVPPDIWKSYRKVTLTRNPFDQMVSRYFWEGGMGTGLDFGEFTTRYRALLRENHLIAPPDGPAAPDLVLRYEDLPNALDWLDIDGLSDVFSSIRTKANRRPSNGTAPSEIYAKHPEAARVVAEECHQDIERHGYTSPVPLADVDAGADKLPKYLFTLTAGRTGTAWLARFLGENLYIPTVHEPLGIDDFGRTMPDIRIMRSFNERGFDSTVRRFWARKFDSLPSGPYAETNHTLGKCGMIEALAEDEVGRDSAIIVLRRDLPRQCASYVMRGDFVNITIDWQWYLSPNYPNTIVRADPFLPMGQIGRALWYSCEMAARQEYYMEAYKDRLRFLPTDLEEISTPGGAQRWLAQIGHRAPVQMPPKTNANAAPAQAELVREIRTLLDGIGFDAAALARAYLSSGRSLAALPVRRVA